MTQSKMGQGHWKKRLPKDKQRTNQSCKNPYCPVHLKVGRHLFGPSCKELSQERKYGSMREPYPLPPEDNVTWRLPKEEVKIGRCGMTRLVTLKTNHRFEVVCQLMKGHKLPHEGIHRWYSGPKQ